MKRILGLTVGIVLTFFAIQIFSSAQAQVGLVESRLARVESELAGIRSQLSQLSVQSGISVPTPRNSLPPQQSPQQSRRFTDAQFDRLATLLIESRDRITTLEAKVAQLEKR